MKNFKLIYLLAFALVTVTITSCSDDDEDHNNSVTITIDEPMDGEIIAMADCADVHIHIDIVASDENHEIEILLHPEGDVDTKIIDVDLHEHDAEINFEQGINLCNFPAGTCFHLEVEACVDHDCEEKATADAEFCLQ